MTIPLERWVLDTNVWVFGLRRDADFPACAELLDRIGTFSIVIPLQLLKELAANLDEDEMRGFYKLVHQHPEIIEVNWQPAPADRIKFFEAHGSSRRTPKSSEYKRSLAKTGNFSKQSKIYQLRS